MTEQEFNEQLIQIESIEDKACRHQGLATLIYRRHCDGIYFGQLGARLGKSCSWVDAQVKFGEFILFLSDSSLYSTEVLVDLRVWDFIALYKHTRGRRRERFKNLAESLQKSPLASRPKPLRKVQALELIMKDGEWRSPEQIRSRLAELFPGITRERAKVVWNNFRYRYKSKYIVERRKIGRHNQYRIADANNTSSNANNTSSNTNGDLFRKLPRKSTKSVPIAGFLKEVGPIVNELKVWGAKREFTIPPCEINILAVRLERLIESLRAKS